MADPRPGNQGTAAVALRLAGASYAEIADALLYANAREARHAVETTLSQNIPDAKARDVLRAEEAGRLERLLRSVWPKATDPNHPEHLPAVKTATGIIDRHIRLHGLDAPAEIVVHTPTAAEIDQWVAKVTASTVGVLAELEDTVIDVEEVTDDLAG